MIIREIKPEDNTAIEAIMRASFREFKLPIVGSSLEDEEVTAMYENYQDDRSIYFVLEQEGEVIGGGGIKQLQGADITVCELQKMYLDPKARGKGYGKQLFDACLAAAKQFNFKQCYLESASQLTSAIRLYEQNGFRILDERQGNTGHVICGVWMLKDL